MKKLCILLLITGVIAGLGYAVSQGLIPVLRTEQHAVREQSMRFFECIQFKEFDEAAEFHNEKDRKNSDIPKMMEDMFKMPPENMDINNIYIVATDIDSSGDLARVKLQMSVRVLNSNKRKNPEVNLFWKKENDKWYLKLKSSLKKFRTPSL